MDLLKAIQPGICQEYLKHKADDPDGKVAAVMKNVPQQYLAPLKKSTDAQKTTTAQLATAENNNNTSNESEDTHDDLDDQLKDPNEEVSKLLHALVTLSNSS
jgi:hypothetical protein